jgi:DNA polymerase I-like protein with 3'-5' exonuclease and polymerase domains
LGSVLFPFYMKLLLIDDRGAGDSYLSNFQRLPALFGHKVVQLNSLQRNTETIKAACRKAGIGGVLCAQPTFLEALLNATPDYIPPPNRKAITLDDYAGSYFQLDDDLPAIVLNPLDRLVSIPYERFVVDRYISKITKPHKWWKETEFKWRMIAEEEDVQQLVARLEDARLVAVDIETDHSDLRTITCVSYTAYYPGTNTTESYCIGFDSYWQWQVIRQLNDTKVAKVFQNGMYDNSYFLRWGLPIRNWLHDTQHLFHSWLSELPKRLDFIASFSLRRIRFWKNDGKTGRFEDLCRYCCLDSWATVNAYLALLSECPGWAANNYLQEFPLVFPGLTAGLEGLKVDTDKFKEVGLRKEAEVEAIRTRISNLLSVPDFNPGSSQQVGNLFKLLGVGYLGSTDKASMLKAKAAHPLNNLLLSIVTDYREAAKLVSNYFQESKLWNSRLFYTFNPAGTDTGRLACTASSFWCGFQIQNIPRGDILKQCLTAESGWFIAEADKAQSEARCVGYLSGDKNLIELVESEHDYHSWNAAAFFGIPYEEIYNEQTKETLNKVIRDLAKRTNHGANYNMGGQVMLDTMGPKMVATAKRVLKLPAGWSLVRVCDFLLARYANTYPDVKGTWYEHSINTIEMTKQLVSPFGWVRIFFGQPRKHKPSLNAAVAHAPQNLSVAIINREWYAIWRETIYGSLRGHVRIKAQIHDSLLFIYKELKYAHIVHKMMMTSVPVRGADGVTRTMTIPTDLSTGKRGPVIRWSELK